MPYKESVVLYGDVNCDGQVNDKDTEYLTKYLANWEGYELKEITVDNTAPTYTVAGPSDPMINKDDTVEYILEYSEPVNIINETNLGEKAHISAFGTLNGIGSETNCYALDNAPYITTNGTHDSYITVVKLG